MFHRLFRKLFAKREILRLMKISVFQQQIFIGISSKYGFIGGTLTKVVTKGQIANLATNPYVILFSRKTRKHENAHFSRFIFIEPFRQ